MNTHNDDFSLGAMVKYAVTERLKNVRTSMPGIIVAFDASTQRAEIQPTVSRVLSSGETAPFTRLINCPLAFDRTQDFCITRPIKVGDECLIFVADRSIEDWLISGKVTAPSRIRFHHVKDAYFLPLSTSTQSVISDYDPDNMVLKTISGDLTISLKPSSELEIISATDVNVVSPNILLDGDVHITGDLQNDGNATVSGNVTVGGDATISGISTASDHLSGGKSGLTHTHGGVLSGGSMTAPPT